MSVETEAKTIVELIRAQGRDGELLVSEADAIALLKTALGVAENRGVIDGIGRMSDIANKVFAPAPTVAP
jgi:hypothetical protein